MLADDPDPKRILKALEDRYNRAKTLQVQFQESYTVPGKQRRTENGVLTLRKPGKMRWDYQSPTGKVFVSDGKIMLLYSPLANKVERMNPRESEDMHAPLAFLLGKLDFNREFQNFKVKMQGQDVSIQADARSEKLPYSQVTFLVSPDHEIRKLTVLEQDQSLLEFSFTGEKMDPAVDDKMFKYVPPNGAEVVDLTQAKGSY